MPFYAVLTSTQYLTFRKFKCAGLKERISAFVDHLLQPIAQIQPSYLEDTTDFINFIEKTKLPSNTTLVSMDVTNLYTNIPQEEGVNTVSEAYEDFYQGNPPPPPPPYSPGI